MSSDATARSATLARARRGWGWLAVLDFVLVIAAGAGSGGSGGTSGADTSGAMGLAMLELEAKIAAFGFETDQAPQPREDDIHRPCCGATFILENGAPTDDGLGGAIAPATGTDFGDLDALTDFLTGGFWTGSDRAHNLTDAGTDPNDGVILYNLTGYDEDADKIPWVHLDIAGTAWGPGSKARSEGANPLFQFGVSGVHVRTLHRLITEG